MINPAPFSLDTGKPSKRDAEKAEYEKKIHELYAEIGRVTTELEWMKKKGIGTKP